MANTVIQLKKSATPSAQPADLANGEIAINYADGKLFYKDSTGTIQQISGGGNTFSTVNAAGTLVVSDLQNDILTLEQGNNIIITGDTINDRITIAADLTPANSWANTKLSNGTVTLDGALTTTGQIYANSQITIYPTGGDEGGELQLWGAASYPDWSIDSYQDQLRFFNVNTGIQKINFFNAGGGSVKLGVNTSNPQYELDVSGDVNVTGKFRINGTELATGTTDLGPANNYTNTSVAAANNYAGAMANAANSYASSLSKRHINLTNTSTIVDGATGNVWGGSFTTTLRDTWSGVYNSNNSTALFTFASGSSNVMSVQMDGSLFVGEGFVSDALGVVPSYGGWIVASSGVKSVYSISAGTDVNAGANVITGNVISSGYIQFADGSKQFTANAPSLVSSAAFDKANAANVLAYNTGIGANAYSDTVGISANNYAGVMANSSNGYAVAVGAAANNWANTKLSNTSGVVFGGNLTISQDLTIGNNITNVTSIIFNTSTNRTPTTPGEITWSDDDSTLRFNMDSPSSVIGHIGQDQFYYVKNQTGSTINKGTPVRFAGTLGSSGRLLVAPAIANNSYPSKYVIGVAAATINNGDDGFVLAQGKLRGIDTSAFSEGDILYVSSSTPGALSNTMPTAPNNKITLAAVIKSDNTQGTIEVRLTLGSKLNEDELVEFDSLTDGDVLEYVTTNGRFENRNTLVSAFNKANAANVLAYNTGIGANAYAVTVGASGNAYTNTVGTSANAYSDSLLVTGRAYTNTSSDSANNYAGVMANGAGAIANAAFTAANQAGTVANNANTYADSTYVKKAGDTITGDLVVQGNATISGVVTYANTQTLLIGDALITLNNDIPVDVAPSEDAGIEVKRGTLSNVSLLWNEGSDKWTFTNDGTNYKLIASNTDVENVAVTANNYAGFMANSANAYAASLTPDLSPVFVVANSAFDKANAANVLAYNTGIGANAYSDSLLITSTNYTNTSTDAANNYAGVMANSANAYAASLTPDLSPVFIVANGAYDKANSANVLAKAAYDFANTLGGGATVSNTAPVSPSDGDLWWNTEYGRLLIYYTDTNSSQWVDATTAATAATVSIGISSPSSPVDGQLWWNSEYGRLFIYYNDVDSSQWVDASPGESLVSIKNLTNTAFDKANSAFDKANSAFDSANSSNNYASVTFGTIINTTAAFAKANAALANTSGVYFDGNLFFPSGNVGIKRTTADYALDVVGTVNASALFVNGSALTGNKTVSVISTSTAAVKNYQYVAIASLTLTLPGSPAAGDSIGFTNMSATKTCVISPNGANIMQVSGDMTVDSLNVAFTLVYADSTRGWVFA